MEKRIIVDKIIEVLNRIQEQGAFIPLLISAETFPLIELPEFDSHIWVTAVSLILAELEIKMPLNVNIFTSEDGNDVLSISQVADRILKFVAAGGKK